MSRPQKIHPPIKGLTFEQVVGAIAIGKGRAKRVAQNRETTAPNAKTLMTWNDLYQELASLMDAHSDLAANLKEKTLKGQIEQFRHLFEIEKANRPAIDAACESYIQTGQFPALNQEQAILLYVRFGQAAQAVEFLLEHPEFFQVEFEDSQKASALHLLLIDYWRFAGRSRWKTT